MAAKIENYTAEMTSALVSAYTENPTQETVAFFAEKFGKSFKSIIAKLSREGIYQKKEYTTKTGNKPISKDELADQIGAMLKMNEADINSLTKANKSALSLILTQLICLSA